MSQKVDKKHIWHPLTQHQLHPEHIVIKKAKGAILYDENGNEYIDAIASWYTCMYGHCNPYITQKVSDQMRNLDHVVFTGFTHKPATDLAKSLMKILIGSTIFLCSSSLIIIGNKGFENRYPSLSNFSLDYGKYRKELRVLKYELGVPTFKDDTKKNLLIIGNSHGRDLFNTLKLNESIFFDYEFSILDTKVSCLKFINENKLCDKTLSKLQKNILKEAEIILISSRYDDKDLLELDNIIEKLLAYNKKVILASNRPQFYFSSNNLTIVDEFFLKNKRLPYEGEKLDLKKKYFLSINPNLEKKNSEIEKIAKNNQIDFINMKDLMCTVQKKTCEFLTSNNSKIMFDDSHFTVEGAKYLGNKIKELKWF